MNPKFMECPECGEIELQHVGSKELASETLHEYKCRCGHYETHGELPEVKTVGRATAKYPGVNDFIRELGGFDAVDQLGKFDLIRAAFVAGRAYEALDALKKWDVKEQAE